MAIEGLRGTGTFTVDGQRPKNFREGILMLYPNGMAPLTGLTSVMKSESTDDPEFAWFEKGFASRRLVLGADVSATEVAGDADTITLTGTGAYTEVKKGMMLMFEQTGEVVRVTADPTTNTIAVIRGVGLTVGAALTVVDHDAAGVNPNIVSIGSAHPEGDMPPKAIAYDPVKVRNYTQIFREKLGFTRTAMKTRLRTGDQVKEARREALEQHSVELERAFIWGRASEIANGGNGHPLRTTGGIYAALLAAAVANPELNKNFGGTSTMVELEEALEIAFRFGSSEKMGFCGNRAMLTIQQIIRKNTHWQFEAAKEYGMNVTRLVCPFGTLVLKTHPLFNLMQGGVTLATPYNSWSANVFILDMKNLRYRYLKDSDTKYIPNVQANGLDGMESEYLTECGYEVHHGKTHMLWTNLTSGVVDT